MLPLVGPHQEFKMSNWNNPTVTSLYTDVLSELKSRDDLSATWFVDSASATNIPVNAVKRIGVQLQTWSGSAWIDLGSLVNGDTQTFVGNKTFSGTVTVSGDLNNTSDERLKNDIETLTQPLNTLKQLRGVSFKWRHNGKRSIGVIAQEIEAVLPELVSTGEDGVKSVSYISLIGLLIEAIKELDEEVKQLKSN